MLVNIKFWRGFARVCSRSSSGARALNPGLGIQRGSPASYPVISSGSWLHPRSRQQPACPAASSQPSLVLLQSNQRQRAPVLNLMRGWKATAAEGDGQRDPERCHLRLNGHSPPPVTSRAAVRWFVSGDAGDNAHPLWVKSC